jgi:type IV secretory pathway VirB10-like protein
MEFPQLDRKSWLILGGCLAVVVIAIALSKSSVAPSAAATSQVPKVTPSNDSPSVHDSDDVHELIAKAKQIEDSKGNGVVSPTGTVDPQNAQLMALAQLAALERQQSMGQTHQEQMMADPMTVGAEMPKWNAAPKESGQQTVIPEKADDPPKEEQKNGADFSVETGSHNRWAGKRYAVFRGTAIECQLLQDVSSDVPGPLNCLTTKDVKSQNGQHVLIPVNTFVSGHTEAVSGVAQHRLEMVFDYLRTPDGFEIEPKDLPAEDANGMNGVTGHTNNHLLRIWAQSLGFGLLGSASLIGNGSPLTGGGTDQLRYGFSSGMSEGGMQMLSRMSQIPPTITLKGGKTVINVVIMHDLSLPSVDEHKMDNDL